MLRRFPGDRYFVLTTGRRGVFQKWATDRRSRRTPASGAARSAPARAGPVATGASLLEFEVVQFSEATKPTD